MRIPQTIKEHWNNVGQLRCMICDSPEITLHHCHGGSMIDRGVMRGTSQKTSDWLVIPLHRVFHTGQYGIDSAMSVREWESRFDKQADLLDEVSRLLGYNVWDLWRAEQQLKAG